MKKSIAPIRSGLFAAAVISLASSKLGHAQQQLYELNPSGGTEHGNFGFSVAINGDRALIGAPQDQENGPSSGAAYVFRPGTGEQL